VPAGNTGKTVGEAFKRATEINKLLKPTYLKATPGQDLTAMEKINLTREVSMLNDAIYDTVSQRSGLPVDQIKRINQRGASLQQLGDQIEASQNARELGVAGIDEKGLPIPHGTLSFAADAAMRLVNKLRGGTLGRASRTIRSAVKQFPEGYEALPEPERVANYRRMVEKSELSRVSNRANTAARNVTMSKIRTRVNQEGAQ
jgi:hypothetical protein